jgi:hypothetical protein
LYLFSNVAIKLYLVIKTNFTSSISKNSFEKEIFGKLDGYQWTMEWQKRGLPHIHLVLFLCAECSIRTIEDMKQNSIDNELGYGEEYFDQIISLYSK